MDKKAYIIDGMHFNTLEEFFNEVSYVLFSGRIKCKMFDSFNDALYGGFGTPNTGFILIWKNSDVSRKKLGYELTAALREDGLNHITQNLSYNDLLKREYSRIKASYSDQDENFYQEKLKSFESIYHDMVNNLKLAKEHKGKTIFDMLVDLIIEHSDIELKLE